MKVEIYPQADSTFSMTDFNLKLFTDAESSQRLSMWFKLPCALADYLKPEPRKWREYKCCLENQREMQSESATRLVFDHHQSSGKTTWINRIKKGRVSVEKLQIG